MTTDQVALDKPPRTERQTQAALRNFALFQLMGMKGNLYHLEGHITTGDFMMLSHTIERSINDLHRRLEETKNKPLPWEEGMSRAASLAQKGLQQALKEGDS